MKKKTVGLAFVATCGMLSTQVIGAQAGSFPVTCNYQDFELLSEIRVVPSSDKLVLDDIQNSSQRAVAVLNVKDKKEVNAKRLVITGKEGVYGFAYGIDFSDGITFLSPPRSVRVEGHLRTGLTGTNVSMPDNFNEALNVPWMNLPVITKNGYPVRVRRTWARQSHKLIYGRNVLVLKVDSDEKFSEWEFQPNTMPVSSGDKIPGAYVPLENNNEKTFVIDLVSETPTLQKPDVKFPDQPLKLPHQPKKPK